MRGIIDFIAALKVPILEIRWWERSSIISKANITAAGLNLDFVLAQHETPGGFLPVLLWYGQYFWGTNLPAGQILHLAHETGYWRLNVAGEPPDEELHRLPDIRKPWSPSAGSASPCLYYGPVTSSKPITELLIHPILHFDIADYAVGGFISGIDIPRQYFDAELKERSREEG